MRSSARVKLTVERRFGTEGETHRGGMAQERSSSLGRERSVEIELTPATDLALDPSKRRYPENRTPNREARERDELRGKGRDARIIERSTSHGLNAVSQRERLGRVSQKCRQKHNRVVHDAQQENERRYQIRQVVRALEHQAECGEDETHAPQGSDKEEEGHDQ